MNEKGRITLRIIAGGYLAYLGFGLLRDVLTKKPENGVLFGAAGVLFLVVGGWFLIRSLGQYRDCQRTEYEDEDIEDEVTDEVTENEESEESEE